MVSEVPAPGEWPVDPQEDVPIRKERIWIDGCFDFTHHGHAGAMLQARRLGDELLIGIHSDEDILHHKGPTVMDLQERVAAVDACRWSTKSVPHAPYVTSLPWITHYGCWFVGHGDDITSDSSGEDCYRYVKAAGRFLVFKRTPGISTTDLVGRMLLCTKGHYIKSLTDALAGNEGPGSHDERMKLSEEMTQMIKDYASDETGLHPGCEVYSWEAPREAKLDSKIDVAGDFRYLVQGNPPKFGQRVVYVDGGFDLFCSGHIEFLRQVVKAEEKSAQARGWYTSSAKENRIHSTGCDYAPYYVVAGIHDDEVINHWKGVNYPIMNIFERGLLVLQCQYIHSVIFSAPFIPTEKYLTSIPFGTPHAVYHGPTAVNAGSFDPYAGAKSLGIYEEIEHHKFAKVNAEEIVQRIMKSREMYEERQRKKGVKAIGEEAARQKELMEQTVSSK